MRRKSCAPSPATGPSSSSLPVEYTAPPAAIQERRARLERLRTVDMAVIVSPAQNEVELMRKAGLATVATFCTAAGVDLCAMEGATTSLFRITRLSEAVNALVAPDDRRKAFQAQARLADRLYAAVKPTPSPPSSPSACPP